jgi:hypothetical protein
MSRPPHSPWFDLPNNTGEEYKIWSFSLCNFLHSPVPVLMLWHAVYKSVTLPAFLYL